jgi:hypothetical protein
LTKMQPVRAAISQLRKIRMIKMKTAAIVILLSRGRRRSLISAETKL